MFDTRSRKERCPQPSYRSQAFRPRLLSLPCSPPKRRGLRDVSISAGYNFFSPTRRGIKVSDRARRRHHIGLATAQKHKFRCSRASRALNRGWSHFLQTMVHAWTGNLFATPELPRVRATRAALPLRRRAPRAPPKCTETDPPGRARIFGPHTPRDRTPAATTPYRRRRRTQA